MRVISLRDWQAGEVPWEVDSGDTVMRDRKSCCRPSKRKRKMGERGLRHPKNVCYDGADIDEIIIVCYKIVLS